MAARLGNVIYWLCCILAAIPVAIGAINYMAMRDTADDAVIVALLMASPALPIWLVGKAIRYVLGGA